MKKNLFVTALGISSILFTAPSCSKNNDDINGRDKTVHMATGNFMPETLTVSRGTTVVWVNDSNDAHTVFSSSEENLDSGQMIPGATYNHTFNTVGRIEYTCTLHRGDIGVIIVTN